MNWQDFLKLNLKEIPSPIHLIDETALEKNLQIISEIQRRSGAKILFALKAFAQHSVFDRIAPHVAGATASSLNESLHARRELGGELHVCAPAYHPEEFLQIAEIADHIVFNSFSQVQRYVPAVLQVARKISLGIRINPEHSEVRVALYDPCSKHSRLGVRLADFEREFVDYQRGVPREQKIEGLHFHTLCEQNCAPLERTLAVVEESFGGYLKDLKWINFGGGHLLTSKDYDRERLLCLISDFRKRYPNLDVYLEPGEAFVRNTGVLLSRVLDIVPGNPPVAILDASAAAHMPDVLEMPYVPEVLGASPKNVQATGSPVEQGVFEGRTKEVPGLLASRKTGDPKGAFLDTRQHEYFLAGPTCLAGDVIGRYVFSEPLELGKEVLLLDMSHYTMVKNTNFNGVRLPAIGICNLQTGSLQVVRTFGYEDYRSRLS